MSHHVYTPITLVMNLEKYKSLTDAQRAAVDQAARAAVVSSRKYGEESDNKLVAEIKDLSKGGTAFNDIDVDAFKQAAEPIAKEIGKIAGEDFTVSVMTAIQ
jgi:TRAP-type C4-dicarboxylate transport system substrate-binding protein